MAFAGTAFLTALAGGAFFTAGFALDIAFAGDAFLTIFAGAAFLEATGLDLGVGLDGFLEAVAERTGAAFDFAAPRLGLGFTARAIIAILISFADLTQKTMGRRCAANSYLGLNLRCFKSVQKISRHYEWVKQQVKRFLTYSKRLPVDRSVGNSVCCD